MEYFVVLIAALFHAIWNSIIKESGDRLMTLSAIRLVGFVFGLIVAFALPWPNRAVWPYLVGAALICLLYFWFLLNAYRLGDFSQVYPIARGSAPMIVLVLGAVFAGEFLSPLQVMATLLISLGILSLAFAKAKPSIVPVGYALGTAVTIAGYTLASGMGVRIAGSAILFAGWLEAMTGLFVLLFAIVRRKKRFFSFFSIHWRSGLTAGVLSVTGFAIALWAMQSKPLAPVAALRETSIIFAAIIGAFILKEGYGRYRVSAACVVVTGIVILIR